MDSLTEMGGNGPLQSGLWGSEARLRAPLLFDIGALVLRP